MQNLWKSTSNVVCLYFVPPNNFSIHLNLFISVWIEVSTHLYILYKRRESSNCHECKKCGRIHYYFTSRLEDRGTNQLC
jgi:hypothetical protein